jgi:NuA3 HAT complex component NTO1
MLKGIGTPEVPKVVPLPGFNPREKLTLPKPSFRALNPFMKYEQDRAEQVNYVDRSMANVGYQESEIYIRPPRKLIRVTEGNIEEDLDMATGGKGEGDSNSAIGSVGVGRVEYDMDEQDNHWLDNHNIQRKAEGVEAIKPAIFEITMTKIEKEWHALEKRIPKPNPKPPQTHRPRSSSAAAVNGEIAALGEEQDSKCAICDDGDCENTNAIVFCDGCDLAVHQECYGVPFIPEGQWLCRKCQLIGRGTPTCIFCPNTDGAFKQTNSSRWAHLLCAIWIPEVSIGNSTFMEPVMDVEKVPKPRWKLTCYICRQKMGACIQCGNKNCYIAFHVTCARRAKLFLKMKSTHGGPASIDASVLKAYCDKHVPAEWRREHDTDHATSDAMEYYRYTMRGRLWADSQQSALSMGPSQTQDIPLPDLVEPPSNPKLTLTLNPNKRKRNEPPKVVWRLPSGAPVIPLAVYNSVESSLQRFAVRKRKEFAAEACKYWTLKRESRRGAALLKRLQLQMETFTSMEITRRNFVGMGAAGGVRLQRRIDFAEQVLQDVGKLREMCAKIKEREDHKLKDARMLKDVIDTVYLPITPILWPILEKAQT